MPAVNTILYAKWTTAPVTPVTCSSFTYSPWSTCVNNTQTHTVTSSSPSGCTGGSPVLTQSCTPTTTVSYVIKTVAGSDASGNPMGVIQKSPDKTTYGAGDVVTVTAVPNATYKFLSWKGGISGTTNPQTITMTSDKTVSANFGQASNTLTIVATNGTVTVSPNKPVYDYGDTVTLTAVPATGYTFSSWSGPFTTGTAITATVYMNGDRTATANFAPVVVAPTASTTATTTSSLSGNQNYATAAVGWDTFLKLLQALR